MTEETPEESWGGGRQGGQGTATKKLHRLVPERPVPGRLPAASQGTEGLGVPPCISWKSCGAPTLAHTDLLPVVGGVREQGGDMEHDLIVLERGVEGVGSRGVGCNRNTRQRHVSQASGLCHQGQSVTRCFHFTSLHSLR